MQLEIKKLAHQFWRENNPEQYQILLGLDSVEPTKPSVNAELDNQLVEFNTVLDRRGQIDFQCDSNLLILLSSLDAMTEFFLVTRYDQAYPGAKVEILKKAKENLENKDFKEYASIILRRHIAVERIILLRRVFQAGRLERILDYAKTLSA